MTHSATSRLALGLALLPLLAGCASAPPESVTERDTAVACRQQAEEMYRLRHRDEIYGLPSTDSPGSGAVGLTLPTAGLSDRYEHDQEISTCIRDTGASSGGVPSTGPAGPGTASPR